MQRHHPLLSLSLTLSPPRIFIARARCPSVNYQKLQTIRHRISIRTEDGSLASSRYFVRNKKKRRRAVRKGIIFCKPGRGGGAEGRIRDATNRRPLTVRFPSLEENKISRRVGKVGGRAAGRRNRVIDRAALQSDFYRLRGPVCTRESNRAPLRKRAHGASMTRRFSH